MTDSSIAAPVAVSPQPVASALCRFCGAPLRRTFVDLGMSPLCESYPSAAQLNQGEMYYPLHVFICESCWLVQLQAYETPENIFSDYAYFASFSDSWLKHCEKYCGRMRERFSLNEQSFVVEVASNDGYLLQYFVRMGIPVLGIEPAANVARAAVEKGVPTMVTFFGAEVARRLAAEGRSADLIAGNNVLAQVPDLNDFVSGLSILLKPEGVLTLEFPHLLRLIEHNEFDTIYHEHFSYFSLITIMKLMAAHGLRVFDVEELESHGGSLRIFACHQPSQRHHPSPAIEKVLGDEQRAELDSIAGYERFATQVQNTKYDLVEFLLKAAREGKSVAGYGAPGKSATLLHYCGIHKDLIRFTVDRSPYKQGRFLPGSRIPIYAPECLQVEKPDYVVILPWNLKDEIQQQLQYIRAWGGRFVVPIPTLTVD